MTAIVEFTQLVPLNCNKSPFDKPAKETSLFKFSCIKELAQFVPLYKTVCPVAGAVIVMSDKSPKAITTVEATFAFTHSEPFHERTWFVVKPVKFTSFNSETLKGNLPKVLTIFSAVFAEVEYGTDCNFTVPISISPLIYVELPKSTLRVTK